MKRIFHLSVIACVLYLATGCGINNKKINGNGNVSTEERNAGAFEELIVSGSMHVYLSQGPVQAVRVEAESNLLPYIITNRQGDELKVKTEDNTSISYTHPINIYLTTPDIKKISMLGSGKIETKDTLRNDDGLKISLAGSGSINIRMNAPEADANIAGSGNITVSGFTQKLDINLAGSGNFKGSDLKSEEAKIKIAGSGSAWVFASVKLSAKILGSGNVHYGGTPSMDNNMLGSGKVIKDE